MELDNPNFKEWKKHMSKVADKLQVPPEWQCWTQKPGFRGDGVPDSPRMYGLLNMGWAKRLREVPASARASAAEDYYADLSQSVDRLPFGNLGTMLQGSVKYSYGLDRVLSAADCLATLGLPHAAVEQAQRELSNSEIQSLAGEAFSLPCISAAVTIFYFNAAAPWWRQPLERC
jgi:hypothetical protein